MKQLNPVENIFSSILFYVLAATMAWNQVDQPKHQLYFIVYELLGFKVHD